VLGASSLAQNTLSAREAVFIALENNYQIQVSEKQVEISEKNNTWSEAGLYPTVSLNASFSNTVQDNTKNPFTFLKGIILSQSLNPSLSANWNIFSGFAVKISKQRLEQLDFQTKGNALMIVESTIQDVLKAYYTTQLQKERLNLFSSLMDFSRKRVKYYELREKYGKSSSLELLQFRNQYLTDSTNVLVQNISYTNAMRNLVFLMNATDEVQDIFPELTDDLAVPLNEMDPAKAKEEMLANSQNLKNQYLALELQKTNIDFQRSFLYPTLSFQVGVTPSYSFLRNLKDNTEKINTEAISYYGNFNLRYTIFNNWKSKRAVEVAKIQEEITTLNTESMEKTLVKNLTNLIELFQARVQLVNISDENLVYATKAFELAQKKFETGGINSIDLASFQNTYQNTLIQHYENLFNKLDTYLEIYKMTGKLGLEYTQK
jgi:outer membrane protein